MSQDWNPVVLTKSRQSQSKGSKTASLAAAKRTGAVVTERKFAAGENKNSSVAGVNMKKLEETDELKHDRVDKSLSIAIQQARLGKNMTQKQLATAMNEKPQVVREYEAGKAIPNPQVISKMERALGVRLPRPAKKRPAAAAAASAT